MKSCVWHRKRDVGPPPQNYRYREDACVCETGLFHLELGDEGQSLRLCFPSCKMGENGSTCLTGAAT